MAAHICAHGQSTTRDQIQELVPESPELKAAEAKINASQYGDAESDLNSYVKQHPGSPGAYYDLGYVHFRTHQIGLSVKEVSKSLELNPNNADAHKLLALDCSIIGRYDLVEVELQQAARLKPESAEIHYYLARAYYTRGVYPLAKQEFETALRLDPGYIKAYSNLGITLEATGDSAAAFKNYVRAVQLEDLQNEKSEWPYIYLSQFYNRQKNPADALRYAQKAIEINSSSDTAYFEAAKAYRMQNQFSNSVEAARHAVAINAHNADYYYVMGMVLREMGRSQESKEALAKSAQLQQASNNATKNQIQEPLATPGPR